MSVFAGLSRVRVPALGVAVFAAIVVAATPASVHAAPPPPCCAGQSPSSHSVPTTGTRINLFPGNGPLGPTLYPANTPFFVRHGWACGDQAAVDATTPEGCLDPTTTFVFLVDGVATHPLLDLSVTAGGIVQSRHEVTNFRFGLPAGTYTFEGQWWAGGVLQLDTVVQITFS